MPYVIFRHGFPSLMHAGFQDKAEAEAEVARLEELRAARNKRNAEWREAVKNGTVKRQRGDSFTYVDDNEAWELREI